MSRVFSGIQPTGNLHLGNYLGAIRHWVKMQDEHECIYGLMDLHAITVPQEPEKLRKATREVAAALIASGVDPSKHVLFPQSAVSVHAELAWVLGCQTPLGWLNRMTQFKEKAGKKKDNASLGLYGYPVLMAADILGYKATHVPVGDDQKQHLELARDIAAAFNRNFDTEYFPLPEPLIMGAATRVMSLRDGSNKMSKSDASDMSRINLTDDADAISKKFKKAKSDMFDGITPTGPDGEERPEAANLLNIYAALADVTLEKAIELNESKSWASFKQDMSDLAVEKLSPITAKMRVLMDDPANIDSFLQAGAERANEIAATHMQEIREIVGFMTFEKTPF